MHIEVQRIRFGKTPQDQIQISPETIHIDDIRDVREWMSEEDKGLTTALYLKSIDEYGQEKRIRVLIKENYHLFCKRLKQAKDSTINKQKPKTKNNEQST